MDDLTDRIEAMPPIEHAGIRVITLAVMDEMHKRPEGTAGRAFRKHREKLREGEDYWEIAPFDSTLNVESSHGGSRRDLIVLSESGYCMLVKTFRDPLAWDVQRAMVNHYFKPSAPKDIMQQLLDRLTRNEELLTTGQVAIQSDVSEMKGTLLVHGTKIEEIASDVRALQPRKPFSKKTQVQHQETILHFYQGRCPCCDVTRIYDRDGKRTESHRWEHWSGRTKTKPSQTWATCNECNMRLEHDDHSFRLSKQTRFNCYQQRREQGQEPLFDE